jgi:hypothetical protein
MVPLRRGKSEGKTRLDLLRGSLARGPHCCGAVRIVVPLVSARTRPPARPLASISGLCDIRARFGIFEPLGESCGSSVVEHSLGKGEVESSILSRSTIKISYLLGI